MADEKKEYTDEEERKVYYLMNKGYTTDIIKEVVFPGDLRAGLKLLMIVNKKAIAQRQNQIKKAKADLLKMKGD